MNASAYPSVTHMKWLAIAAVLAPQEMPFSVCFFLNDLCWVAVSATPVIFYAIYNHKTLADYSSTL